MYINLMLQQLVAKSRLTSFLSCSKRMELFHLFYKQHFTFTIVWYGSFAFWSRFRLHIVLTKELLLQQTSLVIFFTFELFKYYCLWCFEFRAKSADGSQQTGWKRMRNRSNHVTDSIESKHTNIHIDSDTVR